MCEQESKGLRLLGIARIRGRRGSLGYPWESGRAWGASCWGPPGSGGKGLSRVPLGEPGSMGPRLLRTSGMWRRRASPGPRWTMVCIHPHPARGILQHGAFRLQSSRARALPPPLPCLLLFGRAHTAFPRPHFLFGEKRRGRGDARTQRRMRDRYVPA